MTTDTLTRLAEIEGTITLDNDGEPYNDLSVTQLRYLLRLARAGVGLAEAEDRHTIEGSNASSRGVDEALAAFREAERT